MGRTVVLRHQLPDGSHHFDWLIEPEGADAGAGEPDARVLIAWRLAHRPDEAVGGELGAERLRPHRRLYLDYEGAISGGRGEVTRVAEGWARVYRDTAGAFDATARLGRVSLRALGQPISRAAWILRLTPAADL